MRLQPVIDQVQGLGLEFRQSDGVLGLTNLDDALKALPAVFVLPIQQRATDNQRGTGPMLQRVTQDFAVVYVLSASAARREKVSEDQHKYETTLIAGLLGWVHPDMDSGASFIGGTILPMGEGRAAWQLNFRTTLTITEETP